MHFCLKTSIKDALGNVMKYNAQALTLNFLFNGSFNGLSVSTTQFTDVDDQDQVGEKTYTITAKQCDQTGADSSVALKAGDNLYVCFTPNDAAVEIKSITTLNLSKGGGTIAATPVNAGVKDVNTFSFGEGSAKLFVATKVGKSMLQMKL